MSDNNQSTQRSKKAKKNILYMALIKGVSLVISLLYVPLLLHGMEEENYAIWLTLTSIVAWVAMFDIGLGNGLRNRLSEALALENYELGKQYVSTAYGAIAMVMFTLIIFFLLLSTTVLPWNSILNAPNVPHGELTLLVNIVFISFGIHFILGIINSILFALQMPAVSSALTTFGQLLSFIFVYLLVRIYNINSLLVLGTVISITPLFVLGIATIILFTQKYRMISPSINSFRIARVKDILSLGIKFFILQLITIVLYQTNNIIITHSVNNSAVVEYNIAYKYMTITVMLYTIIVTPFWSATTEAYVKNDFDWIKRVVSKLRKLSLLVFFVGVIMVLLSDFIYRIWLKVDTSPVNWGTTILLYLYVLGRVSYSNYGYILNGMGKLKLQIIITSIVASLYIPISYLFGRHFGLNGILACFAAVSIINFIWSKIQYSKVINNTAYGIWNE